MRFALIIQKFAITTLCLGGLLYVIFPPGADSAETPLPSRIASKEINDLQTDSSGPTLAIGNLESRLVHQGDTLWHTFESLEQPLSRWPDFLTANRHLANPGVIRPGDKIFVPRAWIRSDLSLKETPTAESPIIPLPIPPSEIPKRPAGPLAEPTQAQPGPSPAESEVSPKSISDSWKDYIFSIAIILIAILLLKRPGFRNQVKWALIAISILLGFRYLYWRVFFTLNMESTFSAIISVGLFLAEVYGIVAVILFYLQAAQPSSRSVKIPREDELPAVDVFITTFNESPTVLYKTLVACVAMDYPAGHKKIYVLDDKGRSEIKRMTERLGCHYLTRPTNKNAKAGNLNNGLNCTSGEFVMILDCDHIPVRSFLKETIGFFKDPRVAVVQTPHTFYNPDTFQRNLRLEREIVNEQDLFFFIIEPGRDSTNSSFFAGSGGVLRRSALKEIGGFQVITLTEDLHTTMVLHSKGHQSVYLNKKLAAGLAPESYRSYLKQRQRWCRGGIQVFLLDNPLIKSGLSLMQRLNYFGSIVYFFHGWARLVYLSAPLAYLLFNQAPLLTTVPVLLNYFLPYYIVSLMAFNLISKGFRNPFWSDVYETVMSFSISRTALETLFPPKRINFEVTPKGERFEETHLDWSFVLPHIILSGLLLTGLGIAGYRLTQHIDDPSALILSGFWSLYSLVLLITAIGVARERPQKRSSFRLFRDISCELIYEQGSFVGRTSDLSETGLSLSVDHPVFLPPTVTVRLFSDFGETTEVRGEVIRNDLLPSGRSSIGVRFLEVSEPQHQSLIRQLFSSSTTWEKVSPREISPWKSLILLATSWTRTFIKEKILRRYSPRECKQMPCEIHAEGKIFKGVTHDFSNTGLSVRLDTEEKLPKQIKIFIYQGDRMIFNTKGEIVRSGKTEGGGSVLGIRFLETKDLIYFTLSRS